MQNSSENVTEVKEHIKRPYKTNLMSPAGSWASLSAALDAGADSVYFGVEKLNMRARSSKSFHLSDLPTIAQKCHNAGVESYLALNTVLYDSDMAAMREICDAAKVAGVTAVIAMDSAVLGYAKSIGLNVHLSTQANVSNIDAVKFYSNFASVIVLARELTLPQIEHITAEIEHQTICGPDNKLVRIELFVHGALCVSIAGKCYMSLAITNHSANRGDCLQTCRRRFRVIDEDNGNELVLDNKFVMSPKDLCTIGYMDKLIGSGATVFKIEGRGRPPDYVYHTTRAYRQAIDSVLQGTCTPEKIADWTAELERVFNRGFWHGGYYLGHKLGEWSGAYGSKATHQKTYVGYAINYFQKPGIGEFVVENDTLEQGETIAVIGPTTGYVEGPASSIFVNDRPAQRATKNEHITIPVDEKIRRHDKLYVIRKRTK